jgi:poly(A) polymerase
MGGGAANPRHLLARHPVATVLRALNPAGEETRIVGGAIRNALMVRPITDIDLATTLLPEQVMELAKAKGWRAIPTGIAHGTVTLVVEGTPFEITTLRDDVETDGRHAKVRFSRDFAHDAARRDFTINALSMGENGTVHDYFGGKADLAAQRIRFIGDAATRLREDYLRGLRFLRFSAEYGTGRLDEAGFAAILTAREGLNTLSGERIWQELKKLLMAQHGAGIIAQAEAHGLLSGLLGVETAPARFMALLAKAQEGKEEADAITRLYALVNTDGAAIAPLAERLRLSNSEKNQLLGFARALSHHAEGASPRLLAYREPDAALAALLLTNAPANQIAHLRRELASPPRFLITGADLRARGMSPGPAIGQALSHIEAAWIKAGLPDGRGVQEAMMVRKLSGFSR